MRDLLDARAVVLCKPGRTNSHGIDRLSFSEFVNMRPGLWVVRFFKLGHKLASWRFTVRPEGAGTDSLGQWKRRATGRAAARLHAAPFAALERGPEPLAHC